MLHSRAMRVIHLSDLMDTGHRRKNAMRSVSMILRRTGVAGGKKNEKRPRLTKKCPGSLKSGTPSMITRPTPAIATPIRKMVLPTSHQVDPREKVPDFVGGRVGCIRSVRRVALDRLREFLAQRALVGLGRVGRARRRG